MSDQKLIELGRLGRPHGLRGEVRVNYDAESLLLLQGPLWLQAGQSAPRPVTVASVRMNQGQPVIRLEGVEDRSKAETLRGQILLIRKSDLPETEPDEPYVADLLGLPVILTENGETVGTLVDVDWPAGQEIWTIRPDSPDGSNTRDILFPAVPEFVDDIDLDREIIRISPPPGLLELYRSAEASVI